MSAPELSPIPGGVCAPAGFTAAAHAAGIKKPGSDRLDCALVYSAAPAAIAGMFTTNRVKAAPVRWSEGVCIRGVAHAVFTNSGNANAATGGQGLEDTQTTAERVALALGCSVAEVAIMSTGVIGQPLPMERLLPGVDACCAALGADQGERVARAIMTTDTVPKSIAYELALPAGCISIGAMAKGAGMISPNMATMLSVITTDAAIDAAALHAALAPAVARSFNCIAIDNDMSTNDTVLVLANGQSGTPPLSPDTPEYGDFCAALERVCVELAQALVRDGEGATKFVEIMVSGADSDADARTVAKAIAHSQLCKTAFYGQDANWGRIISAAGYSGVAVEPARMDLWLCGLHVLHDGLPTVYSEAEAQSLMQAKDLNIRLQLGDGPGQATFWTSDLSYDYVKINAEYRT